MRLPLRILLLNLALAGCGATQTTYDLSAVTPVRGARGALALDVVRAEPPYDGGAIVIRTADRLEQQGGAQWADTLPRLVESRLRDSLQNAGWRVGDYGPRLSIVVRRFEIDANAHLARVEFVAQFPDTVARLFAASAPIDEIAGAAPAQALDRAFSRATADLARWTFSRR